MGTTDNKYIQLPLPSEQEPPKTKFKPSHLKGIEKLGKVVMPADSDFPSFDEIQADKYLNRMIDYMYEDDRSSILVVLQLFSIMPLFKIRWTMALIESGSSWKGMLGAPFRMLRIALKGLIFTVYYSDMTEDQVIHKKIGYDAKIIM